jgi:hypothetical protein
MISVGYKIFFFSDPVGTLHAVSISNRAEQPGIVQGVKPVATNAASMTGSGLTGRSLTTWMV